MALRREDGMEDEEVTVDDLELDENKLSASASADKGDLFLLTWLKSCERAVNALPAEVVRGHQDELCKSLIARVTVPEAQSVATVKPGRPARALVARILAAVFDRGETKSLFDVVQSLLRGLANGEAKNMEREKEYRSANALVLGQLWTVHGNKVMSLFIDLVSTTTKVFRTSSYPVMLRTAALTALSSAITTSGKSLSDQSIKDTVKALRNTLTDKAGTVARESANCLLAISKTTKAFATWSDIEAVLSPAYKALDGADYATRQAIVHLVASLLAGTQEAGSAPAPTASAQKKEGDVDDDDPYPTTSTSAAAASSATMLSPNEMLTQLSSVFNRPSTSKRLRNAIVSVYGELFTLLGGAWVEASYSLVMTHVTQAIGCGAAAGTGYTGWNARMAERSDANKARFDALLARKYAHVILHDVVSTRLLSEQAQLTALGDINAILIKWPALMPNSRPPSKQTLLIALDLVASTFDSLGCAPPATHEVFEPLLRLTGHPSRSVHLAAAHALRSYNTVAPNKLAASVMTLLDTLNKDLSTLSAPSTPADVHKRAVGTAHALAALVSLVPRFALYVSFDLSAKCMSLAIQLLKQSASHELHVSSVEIQVAWIIVGALMSLGSNFVRLHLPQLLILWRNALPKPTAKDASAAQVRGDNEWAFLLHVREATLGAILQFLTHNAGPKGLVSDDTARRLALLFSNALGFLDSFNKVHPNAPVPMLSSTQLTLFDRELLMRRRLYQCFAALGPHASTQPNHLAILQSAVNLFTDPDRYAGENALQAAVSASAGNFSTVWDEVDGYGFGVTSLMREASSTIATGSASDSASLRTSVKLNRDPAEAKIDELLRSSTAGALEYDSLSICTNAQLLPSRPATGLVDAALEVFAAFWPSQEQANQTALLQLISNNVRSPRMEKNPGRRMAVLANATEAVLGALRQTHKSMSRHPFEDRTVALIREIVTAALLNSDERVRRAGAEAIGRLASIGGTTSMTSLIQYCVNQVVSNTDPDSRAGCALAFGEIYELVGSLAASPVLKTIVDVLLSLSSDPHPLVHYNALRALAQVIDAASLSFAPYSNSTLGTLCRLYMLDTHEPEGGTPGSVNLRADLPAYQAICRVMDALIGVFGPELQSNDRVRELVLLLLREFSLEPVEGVVVEAGRARQHFLIFTPDAIDQSKLIPILRSQLRSSRQPIKVAAVNSVYQLVQRDAVRMSKLGGDGLVQELFALLDEDPSIEGVRDAITSWLKQTAAILPSGWIDLCQRIMTRSGDRSGATAEETNSAPMMTFVDEESQGLGLGGDTGLRPGAAGAKQASRWRTQLFALQCLHEVFVTVIDAGKPEHFDLVRARSMRVNPRTLLVSRVSDLIKMAFTASTAQVMEIRLQGLVVLRDVIQNFASARDVDFEDALLLEQYQAPIAAALTPAFAADSYPEVLSSGVQVCAIFVGSGVVKEIEKMGRILKLLTVALESCRDSDMVAIGDLRDLSSTAAVMLKTSIFAAWAQLQVASTQQAYLVRVVKPQLPLLCPFWVASLREYARLRTDPDAAASDAGAGGAVFDSVYSGLSRETALPFYARSWPQMLSAVASLLKQSDPNVLKAVNGANEEEKASDTALLTRNEPALFFWVLFGLSYEALCTGSQGSSEISPAAVQSAALDALDGLIRREVSGNALTETALFDEVCNLCYRLAITEGPEVKQRVMDVAVSLAKLFATAPAASVGTNGSSSASSLPKDGKLTQCLRVATCVLRESVPTTSSSPIKPHAANVEAYSTLLRHIFMSYSELAGMLTSPLDEEIYAVGLHFYSQLLRDETSQVDLVAPTLPALKAYCQRATRSSEQSQLPRALNGLLSGILQNVDDVKSRSDKAAVLKLKNNLLAAVLLLTCLPSSVKIGQAVVEHACFLISQIALDGESEMARTAMHCLATLLITGPRSSGVVQYCLTQLLPTIVEYIARVAESDRIPSEAELSVLTEVLKAFISVFDAVPATQKATAYSVMLPVMILLLVEGQTNVPPSHNVALQHLLALAASQPAAFKEATGMLTASDRTLLENSIRNSIASQQRPDRSEAAPSINLRSFG